MKSKGLKDMSLYFPAEILNDLELSAIDRIILAVIISHDKEDGCYLKNKNIARMASCSATTVSKSVNKMFFKGYIIENRPFDNEEGRVYVRRVKESLKRK